MSLLAGKIAIVTGAASGIGRAGAHAFAAAGATVVVADINEQGGERVAEEIGGGRAQFQSVDVRDTRQVQRMAANTVARFGRIDVLFHNAMNVPLVNRGDGRATELAEETWHEIIDLVLNGTFYCCKYVGQQMLRQKSGSIILTATTDALIGQAGIDAYTAAKGGVVAMTRSLAAGVSPEGVRVNAVCPGFVETPGLRQGQARHRRRLSGRCRLYGLQRSDVAQGYHRTLACAIEASPLCCLRLPASSSGRCLSCR